MVSDVSLGRGLHQNVKHVAVESSVVNFVILLALCGNHVQ